MHIGEDGEPICSDIVGVSALRKRGNDVREETRVGSLPGVMGLDIVISLMELTKERSRVVDV